jgi:NAD-dependent deacetylase
MQNALFLKENKMTKPLIVFLTGAGISKESGLATFRDSVDGLWNGYNIEEVATRKGWKSNPEKVLEFYNQRRREVINAVPNRAHEIIAELEATCDVKIITQNVDDLHERAGSTEVYHMHGSILKVREDLILENDESWDWRDDLHIGDSSEKGIQLRPDIVWFGENIKHGKEIWDITKKADMFVIVGTSLEVYPANTLSSATMNECIRVYIDPNAKNSTFDDFYLIKEVATSGMNTLLEVINNTEFK